MDARLAALTTGRSSQKMSRRGLDTSATGHSRRDESVMATDAMSPVVSYRATTP